MANGFQYPLPEISYKYTVFQMSPLIRESLTKQDSMNMVSISATVSASANDKIQKWIPMSRMASQNRAWLVSFSLVWKPQREGVELHWANHRRKRPQKEILWPLPIRRPGIWKSYLAINMRRFSSQRIGLLSFSANTFFLGHVDLSDTERTIASKDLEKPPKKPIAIRKWTENSACFSIL